VTLIFLMDALVLTFVACCLASAALQMLAWTRHATAFPSIFGALKNPEKYFDEIGVRQIHLARRLLLIGGAAYLTYGFFLLATMISQNLS
jgi:hypothetical protein